MVLNLHGEIPSEAKTVSTLCGFVVSSLENMRRRILVYLMRSLNSFRTCANYTLRFLDFA